MKADWSKAYSLGDEIQNYLVDCWKYARLENHTLFNTEVTKAVWDKNQNKWELTLKTGNKEEIVFYNWFIRSAIFNSCVAFWHFFAKRLFFTYSFSLDHRIKKLSPRTPPEISIRNFRFNKKFPEMKFLSEMSRK